MATQAPPAEIRPAQRAPLTSHRDREVLRSFARRIDPSDAGAHSNLEVAFFNTGFYDRRVAELRERLRTKPDDRVARWELGRAYALLGQFADAIAEFSELLCYHPQDVG